jgi:hypothetical protein
MLSFVEEFDMRKYIGTAGVAVLTMLWGLESVNAQDTPYTDEKDEAPYSISGEGNGGSYAGEMNDDGGNGSSDAWATFYSETYCWATDDSEAYNGVDLSIKVLGITWNMGGVDGFSYEGMMEAAHGWEVFDDGNNVIYFDVRGAGYSWTTDRVRNFHTATIPINPVWDAFTDLRLTLKAIFSPTVTFKLGSDTRVSGSLKGSLDITAFAGLSVFGYDIGIDCSVELISGEIYGACGTVYESGSFWGTHITFDTLTLTILLYYGPAPPNQYGSFEIGAIGPFASWTLGLDSPGSNGDESPPDLDGVGTGDMNGDGGLNVLDVVALVNIVLGQGTYNAAGDMNGDGGLNVLDVVSLVNIILNGGQQSGNDDLVTMTAPAAHELAVQLFNFGIERHTVKALLNTARIIPGARTAKVRFNAKNRVGMSQAIR